MLQKYLQINKSLKKKISNFFKWTFISKTKTEIIWSEEHIVTCKYELLKNECKCKLKKKKLDSV